MSSACGQCYRGLLHALDNGNASVGLVPASVPCLRTTRPSPSCYAINRVQLAPAETLLVPSSLSINTLFSSSSFFFLGGLFFEKMKSDVDVFFTLYVAVGVLVE